MMATEANPLISCIIPTYNRAGKVVDAINSILSQTYPNLEVLVVDDQSADDTKTVVRQIADRDSRVKYFLNPEKGGNHARNYGIKNAQGKYIAFLDDDDVWAASKLEKQLRPFFEQGPELGVVYCTFARRSYRRKSVRRHPSRFSQVKDGDILKHLLKRNFITTSSILVRAEVFERCGGFDPTYKSFQDWELLTRIAIHYRFSFIREILVNQFESGDSITLDKHGRVLTKYRLLKQFIGLYQKYPGILSSRYSSLAFTLFKLRRFGFALKFCHRSLSYNPFNPEALFFFSVIKLRNLF